MPVPTDRENAERAKEKANEASTKPFDAVGILCPACNEPVTRSEPNPNEYIHTEEGDRPYNDRAAYAYSPASLQAADHPNPWDVIHVVPETAEMMIGDGETEEILQVIAYKHDHTSESYELWQEQLDEIEANERRAEENQGLDDYATDGGAVARTTSVAEAYENYPSSQIYEDADGIERTCPITGKTRLVTKWVEIETEDNTRKIALERKDGGSDDK